MKRRRTIFDPTLLTLVSLLSLLLPSSAATPTRLRSNQNRDAPQQNPPGVTFTLRLKDGKTKFRKGELISVEMLFASSFPNTYRVDGRTYDRSGHLETDTYHVEPEVGTSNPLSDYVQSGMFGSSMGGIAPMPPTLEEKPYIVAQDLNEFVRFDKPGKYRLWVTNNRIAKLDPNDRYKTKGQFEATSSTVEIEILSVDYAWQKQTIQEARAIVEGAKPAAGQMDRRAACRTLRFLDSEAAETEMIRLYRGSTDGCDGEFHFGLVSSPRRQFVIREMETRMTAPDHPVTGSFIRTLSTLAYLARYASPMPPYPAGNEEKMKQWQAEMKQRRDAFQELTAGYNQQLSTAVWRKEKSALAVSLDTLLEVEASLPNEKRTIAGAVQANQLAAALVDIFLDLPSDKQYTLLTMFWKRIASPSMLPSLRRLIEKPSAPGEGTFSDLRGIALKRLFELAPEEGRRAILREIQRTPLRVRPQALSILPDETLPELDEMLSERLARHDPETEYDVVADYSALIARYATSASLPIVKRALANKVGKMACSIQSAMLAFLLRVDPDYGAEVLEQALAARKETGCYKSEFSAVSSIYSSAKLEEVAVAHLDDSEMIVAIQAAAVLGQYGSAAAEQHLMDRLEQWHDQWDGRQKEVQPRIENGIMSGEPAQFETELVRALIRARAWVADLEKLNRIRQLCLTPPGRKEVDAAIRDWGDLSIRVTFSSIDDSPNYLSVAQYPLQSVRDLKEKLRQFSKGTAFVWRSANGGGPAEEQLFSELKEFLVQHDMKLAKPDK